MGKKNNNTITSYDNPPEKIDGDLFYSLQLDKEQEEFANAIWNKDNDIIFCNSKSGSGKTTIAVGIANLLVQYQMFSKIIYIVSPCAEGRLGFLPGDVTSKSEVYYEPLYNALQTLGINPFTAVCTNSLVSEKYEEGYIKPLTDVYLRGVNFKDAVIIIDESQNATFDNLKKTLTRIGENCKTICIGHTGQIDLPNHKASGFEKYLNHFSGKNIVRFASYILTIEVGYQLGLTNWRIKQMAKITKKNVLSVQGIVNIENGKITFSVEDIEGEIALAELMSDFNGQEVKLSVNQTDEIA